MIYYAYYTNTGQYVQAGTAVSEVSEYDIPEGCSVYYGEVDAGSQYHNLTTGHPANKGTPPAAGHMFDYATKTWVPNTSYLDSKWPINYSPADRMGYIPTSTARYSCSVRVSSKYYVAHCTCIKFTFFE
jgi:hypothetical protein